MAGKKSEPLNETALSDAERLALRQHYSAFLDKKRILLTGHSHQAWPDIAEHGMRDAFFAAAEHVDDKWRIVMEKAQVIRQFIGDYFSFPADAVALAANTHELVTRFLSGLDLKARPRIVTTQGEFHSMRRQLMRLAEAGVEVAWIDIEPFDTLGARLADAACEKTAAVLTSSVLFETSRVVADLDQVARKANAVGAQLLIDAYHQFRVLPWQPLEASAYVVAGGYKYAQWGEGVCFMCIPKDCTMRPVYTGWFSAFDDLANTQSQISYGSTLADRFAGSTFDPTSYFRAAAVIAFFESQHLSQTKLSATYAMLCEQIAWKLKSSFEAPEDRAGFIALKCPSTQQASTFVSTLRNENIFVDARGAFLRLGPAPYTLDAEIDDACNRLISLR